MPTKKTFPNKWKIKDCKEVSDWLQIIFEGSVGDAQENIFLTFQTNNYEKLKSNWNLWSVLEIDDEDDEFTEISIEEWREHFLGISYEKSEENLDYLILLLNELNIKTNEC